MTPDMSRLKELVHDALNPPPWMFVQRYKSFDAVCPYCTNLVFVGDSLVIKPHNCPADGASLHDAAMMRAESEAANRVRAQFAAIWQ